MIDPKPEPVPSKQFTALVKEVRRCAIGLAVFQFWLFVIVMIAINLR
jgi:hypothetical protein